MRGFLSFAHPIVSFTFFRRQKTLNLRVRELVSYGLFKAVSRALLQVLTVSLIGLHFVVSVRGVVSRSYSML